MPIFVVSPYQCTRRDLNPHTLRYWILSPARLPVPPLVLFGPFAEELLFYQGMLQSDMAFIGICHVSKMCHVASNNAIICSGQIRLLPQYRNGHIGSPVVRAIDRKPRAGRRG